ncbi:MAG: hypothetical protein AAF497_25120, partial [Planctomycetota bacterium]
NNPVSTTSTSTSTSSEPLSSETTVTAVPLSAIDNDALLRFLNAIRVIRQREKIDVRRQCGENDPENYDPQWAATTFHLHPSTESSTTSPCNEWYVYIDRIDKSNDERSFSKQASHGKSRKVAWVEGPMHYA